MKRAGLSIVFLFGALNILSAQSLTKEAMNNFALYTSKNDFASLEKARKGIDDVYKTRKDSFSYKNNLIRSLVYSSLAYSDSTRKLKYVKDPIDEALFSLNRLRSPKLNDEHQPEISYAKKQISKAWINKANHAALAYNYQEAYNTYLSVDSLDSDNHLVTYNLAVLSEKLGNYNQAISYYEKLIDDKQHTQPDFYLALSNLYDQQRNSNKSLEVLQKGRKMFPGNRDILFKEINIYAENNAYSSLEGVIEDALKFDPDDVNLNYLAGFSFEATGKKNKAEQFYKKVISLDQNSYEGHYSLGILYLDLYLNTENKQENRLQLAKKHLLKAGEINPNSVNVLKSLAVLYNQSGNMLELERVNNKLKQFILINR